MYVEHWQKIKVHREKQHFLIENIYFGIDDFNMSKKCCFFCLFLYSMFFDDILLEFLYGRRQITIFQCCHIKISLPVRIGDLDDFYI